MTLDIAVETPEGAVTRDWALNEAALEKRDRARMLEVAIGVDGQAVSSFGCDGLVVSTPTGSTAYAFSGGGPVIWPEVEAILLVPLAAHALFTRPLVVGPDSCLEVVVQRTGFGGAEIWCDEGIILMGKDFENPWGKKTSKGEVKMMSQLLNSAVFPGIQGGPLEHVIAATTDRKSVV